MYIEKNKGVGCIEGISLGIRKLVCFFCRFNRISDEIVQLQQEKWFFFCNCKSCRKSRDGGDIGLPIV